jgi:predicted RNase H-like HicB family nuclease
MDFLVVLEENERGIFIAKVPQLPGCHTQGSSRKEALANIREAIELYLSVEGTPEPRTVTVEHVTVEA